MTRERGNLPLDYGLLITGCGGRSNSLLEIGPWMSTQEVNFPVVTYWEGAVRFEGTCNGKSVNSNGYIELTGYAGNLPLL